MPATEKRVNCRAFPSEIYLGVVNGNNPGAEIARNQKKAPLAQLDRASVYETEGYWFESSEVY